MQKNDGHRKLLAGSAKAYADKVMNRTRSSMPMISQEKFCRYGAMTLPLIMMMSSRLSFEKGASCFPNVSSPCPVSLRSDERQHDRRSDL